MKIVRHDSYIKQRKRQARLMSIVGFLMLIGTLFLALNPALILPSYFAMLVGFVVFNIGMQQLGKWGRSPRNDQIIDHRLQELPDRYTMVHFAPVGKRRIDHALVHPGGLAVLTSKEIDGTIELKKGRWRRRSRGLRRFFSFSGPQLGNPTLETEQAVTALETHLAENQFEVPVEGAVVFVHPGAELNVDSLEFPALYGDELPQFVSQLASDDPLTPSERERLVSLLRGEDAPVEQEITPRRRPVKRRAA